MGGSNEQENHLPHNASRENGGILRAYSIFLCMEQQQHKNSHNPSTANSSRQPWLLSAATATAGGDIVDMDSALTVLNIQIKIMDSSSSDAANSLILEEQTDFVVKLLREVSNDGRSRVVSPFSVYFFLLKFRELIQSSQISPFSVAVALSMAYAGAKEETSQEIGQLLAKSAPESAVHEYFDELIKAVKKRSRSYTLDVANKMYVKDGLAVTEEFETIINRHYNGQFEALDFEESVESAKKINKVVEKTTHDKIHDLINPNMLNDMTRLVLINAVYFRGQWRDNFSKSHTSKRTFYIDENNKKELDTMWRTDTYIYASTNELQLLGMPYKGDEMFMFVLLPKERFGLAKMLTKLDGKSLLELVKNRTKHRVHVELPKFKLESTNSANFEGIATEKPLKIDKMVQKAFIEVDESGIDRPAVVSLKCFTHPKCISLIASIV
uniref:Serpin domain-containing protein n=1 Tax=Globodera rostochiensis TaxID=31243 RepID=A0A914GW56_GLORO